MSNSQKIKLIDDPELVYRQSIAVWKIPSDDRVFLKESTARYAACTHRYCQKESCNELVEKHSTYCVKHTLEKRTKAYFEKKVLSLAKIEKKDFLLGSDYFDEDYVRSYPDWCDYVQNLIDDDNFNSFEEKEFLLNATTADLQLIKKLGLKPRPFRTAFLVS